MTTITTYEYEASEGAVEGSAIPSGAHGVTSVTGSPTWSSVAAIHGSFGWVSPPAINGGRLTYTNPTPTGSSGSIYFKQHTKDTSTGPCYIIAWRGATGGSIASVQIKTAGLVSINNDSLTGAAVTTSTSHINLDDLCRFDWQQTYSGGNITITLRIFLTANAEGTVPDETITATFATVSPTRVAIGQGAAGDTVYYDTLRLYDDTASWPTPYAPSASPGVTYGYDSTTGDSTGVDGLLIPAGINGVLSVNGTPTYSAPAAIHGTLGAYCPDTGGGRVTYAAGTLAASTGSVYFNINDKTSDLTLFSFRDSSNNAVASVTVTSANNQFKILNGAGTTAASGTIARVNIMDNFRVDWQKTYDGTNMTLTIRVFTGDNWEWTIIDETITATFATGQPVRISYGQGSSSAQLFWDTIRHYDGVSSWPSPYNPTPPPPPTSIPTQMHSWIGASSSDGFVVVSLTQGCTNVKVAISESPSMIGAWFSSAVVPDSLGYIRHIITGLEPDQQYYYQLFDTPTGVEGALFGSVGRSHTLPPAGSPQNFTVAFGSCSQGGSILSEAVNDMVSWNPTFMVHLGDLHYKGINSSDPDRHKQGWAEAIAKSPNIKNMCANIPMFYAISDHEYSGNNGDTNSDGPYGAAVDALHVAYKQVVPSRNLADPNDHPIGLYQTWVVGRVRFILIDVRNLERSPSQWDDTPGGSNYHGFKTYLGPTQKAWFKQQLLKPEPLKVILSDTAWAGTYDGNGSIPIINQDKWRSYATERQEIADFIVSNQVNVDFWGGDTHMIGADLTHNAWGGFPMLASSPFDQHAFTKGFDAWFDHAYAYEDYVKPGGSGGPNGGAPWGPKDPPGRQYMRVEFVDNGSSITRIATSYDVAYGVGRFTQTKTWVFAEPYGVVSSDNALMRWNGMMVTDHNRTPLSASVERIENKQRMASGTLRRTVIAKKRTWSVSWDMLPHSNSTSGVGTVDGGMAGKEIKDFYDRTDDAFQMDLFYGDGSYETVNVMFTDFSHDVQKRGLTDFWSINLSLEEV